MSISIVFPLSCGHSVTLTRRVLVALVAIGKYAISENVERFVMKRFDHDDGSRSGAVSVGHHADPVAGGVEGEFGASGEERPICHEALGEAEQLLGATVLHVILDE